MKVLLVRPLYNSIFSVIDPVITEPLELEYLTAGCRRTGAQSEIYDGSVSSASFIKKLKSFKPDIVAISGYITARDIMLAALERVKEVLPGAFTVVGGVHAELNEAEFYAPAVDCIVHSGGVLTFEALLQAIMHRSPRLIDGVSLQGADGGFTRAPYRLLDLASLPFPDRSHFYANRHRYKYMHYGPVALVKSAWGCPFSCNFCYCTELYEGRYLARPMEHVVEEIASIENHRIWIIDDTFLVSRKRVERFMELVRERGLNREFLVYSRADFIAKNRDLLPLLREVGVIDVIVGLEAADDRQLAAWNKENSAEQNELCVTYLRDAGMAITALFMVDVDATVADFRRLEQWIDRMGIEVFTLSVFLPIPGTPAFDQYKDRLTTTNIAKWDFLHLVLEPANLSRWRFYYEMYRLYGRMLLRNPKNLLLAVPWLYRKVHGIKVRD